MTGFAVTVESRALRAATGAGDWAVLEDLLLDATFDERGALVAVTNVRRLAANLGVSKDTAARALRRLAEVGLVARHEQRADRGTFATVAYAVSIDLLAGLTLTVNTPINDTEDTTSPAARPTPRSRSTRPRTRNTEQASLFELPAS